MSCFNFIKDDLVKSGIINEYQAEEDSSQRIIQYFAAILEKHKPISKCPFCGGESSLSSFFSFKTRLYFVMCKCNVCGAQGKTFSSEINPEDQGWNNKACNDAIYAWNMRQKKSNENY